MKKFQMNIMTSCDDGIAEHILPQLASLAATNSRYDLHFYLFHTDISDEKIALIGSFAESVGITFHNTVITDTAPYEHFAKLGGKYPEEAFYTIGLEKYLPPDMDRILYIDAGDIIINGELARYYFDDFEGKAIIAASANPKVRILNNRVSIEEFTAEDLAHPQLRKFMTTGIINSGVVLYNLPHIRENDYSTENFTVLADALNAGNTGEKPAFFADQGLLSVGYLGDQKLFGFPQCVFNQAIRTQGSPPVWFTLPIPYNYTAGSMLGYSPLLSCEPIVLHFDFPQWKPWKPDFTEGELLRISSPDYAESFMFPCSMKDFQAIYWKYAHMTPIYEKLRNAALEHCKNKG
jgi:lipopolysaccharide biosynthesis glycosyltransferase